MGRESIEVLCFLFCVFWEFCLFLNFVLEIYGIGIRAVGESLYFVSFLGFGLHKYDWDKAGGERVDFCFVF